MIVLESFSPIIFLSPRLINGTSYKRAIGSVELKLRVQRKVTILKSSGKGQRLMLQHLMINGWVVTLELKTTGDWQITVAI